MLCSCHQSISSHVVKPIRIELTGDNCTIDASGPSLLNQICYIRCKTPTKPIESCSHFSFTYKGIGDFLMIRHRELELLAYLFKCVAVRTVTEIMNESCRKGNLSFRVLEFAT